MGRRSEGGLGLTPRRGGQYLHTPYSLTMRVCCPVCCRVCMGGWPLHDIAIANFVWCMAYEGGVGLGGVYCSVVVQ